ncbi:unnamed protein product (macronuclear) [Paramecium tetraurelia]|uniref:Uncharacterized protein n=1 Tax=Paramecium tetraurelia TaxID=5888 RepID=A0DRZ3_PARTE|nr:uncharacterized protein GSPATT00019514001 [Paramecium tetraurelia]CAK85810.1 unnamed protein product [Paramecium tetraurelia]|eukprot:XP_001453207.1 hypothetical protein (macronuclear) [Paramecium tetraurelia strain d4-2]
MKNLKLTNFEEFKKNYLDENDKIKVFKYFYQYNNCFGLISQEDVQDCQQAEFLEKARTYSAFLSMSCLMLTLDRTLFRRSSFKPTKFLFQYGVLPMMSFQITKNYFCRDVEQTFHDMTEKYQFGVEQYHQGMELMTRAHKANRLGEFLEKGVDFDWSTVENE